MNSAMRAEAPRVVIVGQGYVGLPLAQAATNVGLKVVGFDINAERVGALNAGQSVVDDISDADLVKMLEAGYSASANPDAFQNANVVVICVPTPLKTGNEPDLGAVRAAARTVSANISKGTLVVLESTTYPGTTANEVAPLLAAHGFTVGTDVFLAFSPERVDPGNQKFGITNTPKVVGADDVESSRRAIEFYETFVETVVAVRGTAEAELTKLLENTYRHINIGLVNELAVACHELKIDVWEVIRAASTKPFGFQAFYPGPGVGGHCIPIDPNYLNYQVRQVLDRPFRFVELAQDINSSMPSYVVTRAQDILNTSKRALNGSAVLLLGVTYKSGISDTRESPAEDVARTLIEKGARVSYFDPKVGSWEVDGVPVDVAQDLRSAVSQAELTILLQDLPGVDLDELSGIARAFFDSRGVTKSTNAIRL